MLRRLRRILAYIGLGLAGLLVVFFVLVALQIRVELDPLREPFEALASEHVGREVKLEGDFFLVPTWSLVLEANELRIANPEGWGGSEFARLELARFRFAVFPLLLRRRLVVRELRAEGVEVRCERRADGAVNWAFGDEETPAGAEGAGTGPEPGDEPAWQRLLPRALVIRRLALRDVLWRLDDVSAGVTRESTLDRLEGTVATDEPLQLSFSGLLHGHHFDASLETGDPDLLVAEQAWPLESVIEIAGAKITLNAQLDERSWDFRDALRFFLETATSPLAFLDHERVAAMTLGIEAERLAALEPVFGVSLPPWGPIDFTGRFQIFGGGAHAGRRVDIQDRYR